MSRGPRCERYTICTAMAPGAVRTYGIRPLHDADFQASRTVTVEGHGCHSGPVQHRWLGT